MSAAAAWELSSVAGQGERAGRPRLVLVPPVASSAASAQAPRRGALRITRRGRLALMATVAVVLAVVALRFATGSAFADHSVAHQVTVPAGATLSEVAARELPDRPVVQGVIDLQRVNGLDTPEVHAGQVLTVPGR